MDHARRELTASMGSARTIYVSARLGSTRGPSVTSKHVLCSAPTMGRATVALDTVCVTKVGPALHASDLTAQATAISVGPALPTGSVCVTLVFLE